VADYVLFLKVLGQTWQRYPLRLFGYCLMTNHFHLLLAPEPGQAISRIPQSMFIYDYAISRYDDWHRQAWAAALVLLGVIMALNFGIRLATRRRVLLAGRAD
jgi:ABC-type phosphate transport system permease subunit